MKSFTITMHLTINPGYPSGSRECGYRLNLFLDDDFRVNASHLCANRDQYVVTRFWENEPDQQGKITVHWGDSWYFELENGTKEPIYHFSDEKLLPGEFIDIRDHGNQMHIFKIISTELVSSTPLATRTSRFESSSIDNFDIRLSILPSDYEALLDFRYSMRLSLDVDGYVSRDAWACRKEPWKVCCVDGNENRRVGEVIYSNYTWYFVFEESETIYELMWQLEDQCFFADDINTLSLGIRDRSGHWHQYAIDSVEKASNATEKS